MRLIQWLWISSIVAATPTLAANPEMPATHAHSAETAPSDVPERASILERKPRVHDGFRLTLASPRSEQSSSG
jgi:hypothetical protein